jgi:cellulose biosynthesis protein BcsQ
MRVLATYNIKGGVGKTATAVNLAFLSALNGKRTLVWDLDPQGAASFYFRIKPRVKGGAEKLIRGRIGLDARIKATDFPGLHLLPADFTYRHLDLYLDHTKNPVRRLARVLEPLRSEYDLIMIDCAPSISLVSESVFRAADTLLVPTIPTHLSLRTLHQMLTALQQVKTKRLQVLPFFSMVDRRKALHRQIAELGREIPVPFLQTQIPYSSLVEQMGTRRAPLHAFTRASKPALAFESLWGEVKAWMKEKRGFRTGG